MSKTYKIALGVFFLLLAGLVWLEANEPEPINWSESYSANDKIPLGTYLFMKIGKIRIHRSEKLKYHLMNTWKNSLIPAPISF